MMMTATCCFVMKCWTLIGLSLVITEFGPPYKSKAETQHFTCRLPAVTEIQHVLHTVGHLPDLGRGGGGRRVFCERRGARQSTSEE